MRILIADDDETILDLLEQLLGELGHGVSRATDGVNLLKKALEEAPDMILTDLFMPGLNGGTVAAMMEAHPALAGIPLVVISGAARRDAEELIVSSNVVLLPKPLDLERVVSEVGRVSARRAR